MLRFKEYLLERVDTTLNASITELFPAIAFNMKYKPHSVEDFKKFIYTLNSNSKNTALVGSAVGIPLSSPICILENCDRILLNKSDDVFGFI